MLDAAPDAEANSAGTLSRRRLLYWLSGGVGAVVVASFAGVELVEHGVLPGKQFLDEIDGACSVPAPALSFAALGPSVDGRFYSKARGRAVGYTLAYPPGHGPGSRLPLIVMLHGFGDDHRTALVGMTPAQAVALRSQPSALTPMAIVTVDGGDGYWNPHPGDDPQAMVVDSHPDVPEEGLGGVAARHRDDGNLHGRLRRPHDRRAPPRARGRGGRDQPRGVDVVRPGHAANAGAFASRASFSAGDVVAHAEALRGTPVRVASGIDDPFHPGVQALISALPAGSVTLIAAGCHTDPFFVAQEPPSLTFLSRHLA